MKKIVVFGAGKIGRSFIGQLFSRSGYEVVFIDKDKTLVDALNHYRSYWVEICDTVPETVLVENVRGTASDKTEAIAGEIATADVLAVSVGKNALPFITGMLAEGLLLREKMNPGKALDIILAENMREADTYMRQELARVLPAVYPLNERVGLVETSIGKMVPLRDDRNNGGNPLTVYAEAYNTLIVNKDTFINPIPQVQGLEAKSNMKAWVDRKQFIHNFGHAATAYLGYLHHPDATCLWEVLADSTIREQVCSAMTESAAVLQAVHPGVFSREQLQEHIDDLVHRFTNRHLGDTLFRVGCDLYRKLSPDDRLVVPLTSAHRLGLPYSNMIRVLKASLHFNARDAKGNMFPDDVRFHEMLEEKGAEIVLKDVCGLDDRLIAEII